MSKNDHSEETQKNPALYMQPAPASNEQDLWPLVIKDMEDRDKLGKAKYGIALRPHNGRNALIDAYQEVLDLSVYLRQEIEEQQSLVAALEVLHQVPGFEKSTISDIGKSLIQLIEKIDELRNKNRELSATVMHYKTAAGYISGFDDGIEATISAIESITKNKFNQQTIDSVYQVVEDRQSSAKSS